MNIDLLDLIFISVILGLVLVLGFVFGFTSDRNESLIVNGHDALGFVERLNSSHWLRVTVIAKEEVHNLIEHENCEMMFRDDKKHFIDGVKSVVR